MVDLYWKAETHRKLSSTVELQEKTTHGREVEKRKIV